MPEESPGLLRGVWVDARWARRQLLLTYTEVDMEVRKSKVGVPEWGFSLRHYQF